jgi:hypothetical protein
MRSKELTPWLTCFGFIPQGLVGAVNLQCSDTDIVGFAHKSAEEPLLISP